MTDVTTAQSSQIVQFASNNLGQRVGDGQCFALVDQALRSIGARSASDFGDITPTANYVWGREVTIDLVQAGDAIQFQNYSFQETITTRVTNPDGSSSEETETRSESRPHHSVRWFHRLVAMVRCSFTNRMSMDKWLSNATLCFSGR